MKKTNPFHHPAARHEQAMFRHRRRRVVRSLAWTLVGLTATGLLACKSGENSDKQEARPRRNIVLITIDTLRADHVGFYHYDRPTTPNIDRLADWSVSFGHAVSTSSWTLPAHASILTGLYPAEHGVVSDINALPPSAPTLATILAGRGYDTFAAVSHVYLSHRWGFDRGFATFDDSAAAGSPQRPVAAQVVNRALEWIDHRTSDQPFFMWLHIFDPHWDYAPPAPFDRKFDPDYAGSMRGDYASLKPYIKEVSGSNPPPLAPRDLEHLVALYDGEIAYVDHELGRLFKKLETPALADNTVVIVTSDHGEEFMEHDSLEGHQWTLFDEVILVPLIMRFPEADLKGRHIESEVSTVTIAGTLLDYLGIKNDLPSAYSMITDEPGSTQLPVEALSDLTIRRKERQLSLRLVTFKLIRHDGGRLELFRIPHRGERKNVAATYAGMAKRMNARIDELLAGMKRLPDAGIERQPLDAATREKLRATGYLQ